MISLEKTNFILYYREGKNILAKYNQINTSLILNYFIIIYAFVLPISRAGVSLLTAALVFIWIVDGNFRNKFQLLSHNKVIISLFLFIMINFLSLFWTDDLSGALNYIRRYWYLLPLLIIFSSIKKEFMFNVIVSFFIAMLISESIAYGVFFELWSFKDASISNPSPFMHHIEYSIFLAFSAIFIFGKVLNTEQIKYRVLYLIFFLSLSGNLFIIAARIGQIAFVLGIIVILILSLKNKIRALFIGIIFGIVVFGLANYFSETFHYRLELAKKDIVELSENKNYCTSWGSRVGIYITSKDMVTQSPIFGKGIMDNMSTFQNLVDTKYPEMKCIKYLPHMHSQYFQILTQLGIVGLVLFLSILYLIGKIRVFHQDYQIIKYSYVTVLIIALVAEVLLHRAFSLALFSLVVGILLAQNRIENEV